MPLRRSRKRRSRSPCRYGRKKSVRRGCKSRPGPKRRSRKKSPRRVRKSRKKSPRKVRRSRRKSPRKVRKSRKKSPRKVRRSRRKSPRRFRYRMNQQEQYPLHRAIENNDINMVRQLILNRYDVNTRRNTDMRETPLILAISLYRNDIIQVLINAGADLNMEDNDRLTPLMNSFIDDGFYNHVETTELLLDNNANVNYQNQNGETALHIASQLDRTEIIRILVDRGANVNIPDRNGNTPLVAYTNFRNYTMSAESAEILINNGADVNYQNRNGITFLMWAAYRAAWEPNLGYLIMDVIDNGRADVSVTSNWGWDVQNYAQEGLDEIREEEHDYDAEVEQETLIQYLSNPGIRLRYNF